jgi:hypothetical protein
LKIFTNFEILDLSNIRDKIEDSEITEKINLPQLKSLKLVPSSDLKWFSKLNLLRSFYINSLNKIDSFIEVIDTNRLKFLYVAHVDEAYKQFD